MQAASGQMKSGEEVISHRHQTMEEFYFFNKGVAKLIIDNVNYDCIAGTFVKIPANAVHSFIATEDIDFTYWGIAL